MYDTNIANYLAINTFQVGKFTVQPQPEYVPWSYDEIKRNDHSSHSNGAGYVRKGIWCTISESIAT